MTAVTVPTTGEVAAPGRNGTPSVLPAAVARSVRVVAREPMLLVNPLAMSVFFMLIYVGQLGAVGGEYLGGTQFTTFVLPLILVTGATTGAGAAGTLLLRDVTSGYLSRLQLAAGSVVPFLVGALIGGTVVLTVQAALTVAAGSLLGFDVPALGALLHLVALAVACGVAISLLAVAAAVRWRDTAMVTMTTTVFFGLCFFTGVFAPVEQLASWMRVVARVNPLSSVIDGMRGLVVPGSTASVGPAWLVIGVIALLGAVMLGAAVRHERNTR